MNLFSLYLLPKAEKLVSVNICNSVSFSENPQLLGGQQWNRFQSVFLFSTFELIVSTTLLIQNFLVLS